MDKYQEITELLRSQNIDYQERGDELIMHCPFNDCDADSRGTEAHFYINKTTGLYECKKCGEKGNLLTLKKHFGIEPAPKPKRTTNDIAKRAAQYHAALPENIREYLRNERLLRDDDIDDYQLGYVKQRAGLSWITIPVTDKGGNVLFMKLRQDPFNPVAGQEKYKSTGGAASIYNAQILKDKPDMLVICEGEFDCLVLQGLGIPAICSTAGATTFKESWVAQLDFVREFYVLLDNDDAGRKGAKSLIEKLTAAHPNSSIMRVTLPSEVGEHGDVTDFFKLKLGSPEDLFKPDGKYVTLAAGIKPINIADLKEISLDEVAKTLSLTIKHDYENKLIAFLCMLSAYTESGQLNISFNAPSSSGKTYITTEIAKLFPVADKIELSSASPTAFFHGKGVYDSEREAKIVPLSRKILIVYEQLDPKLQERLRSVLSHDKWEQNYYITNKDKKGAHRTEEIILQGFPATVFCSAGMRLDEQEATRAILLSPEATEDKLKEGVYLQAQLGADQARFEAKLEAKPERIALKNRILAIKRENVGEIVITNPDDILERFHDTFKKLKPRHMRDMAHLIQLVKAIALLNIWYRQQPDGTIVANQADIDQAFDIWHKVIESQNWNVPPAVLNIYKAYILPAYYQKKHDPDFSTGVITGVIGLTRKELSDYHLSIEGYALNDDLMRKQILPQLVASGLIVEEKPQEGDKRSPHIFPKYFPPEVKDPYSKNNTGEGGGVADLPQEVIDLFFGGTRPDKPEAAKDEKPDDSEKPQE